MEKINDQAGRRPRETGCVITCWFARGPSVTVHSRPSATLAKWAENHKSGRNAGTFFVDGQNYIWGTFYLKFRFLELRDFETALQPPGASPCTSANTGVSSWVVWQQGENDTLAPMCEKTPLPRTTLMQQTGCRWGSLSLTNVLWRGRVVLWARLEMKTD